MSLDVAAIRASFEQTYTRLYGRIYAELQLEIMNFRLSAAVSRRVADAPPATTKVTGDGKVGNRKAYCPRDKAWKDFSVHRRDRVAVGATRAAFAWLAGVR